MDQISNLNKSGKVSGWLLLYGAVLVILGIIAISAASLTTLISVVFLGVLLLIGGIVSFIYSCSSRSRANKKSSLLTNLLISLLYIVAGILLINRPMTAAISLTLILATFYIVVGIFRIFNAISARSPSWGWSLFSGLIALLLGILIVIHWPASSLFIIGLFVGIDLLFYGWVYIIWAFSRKSQPQVVG